jgi:hypothetical protein
LGPSQGRWIRWALPAVALLCVPLLAEWNSAGFVSLASLEASPLLFHTLVSTPVVAGVLLLVVSLPKLLRINLLVLLGLWLMVEAGALLIEKPEPASEGDPVPLVQPNYYREHPVIGYELVPNNKALHISRFGGQLEFEVEYEVDTFGRRMTPVEDPDRRTRFALFLVDSNTYGEGLHQDQTMAYHFGQIATDYMPYNYALHGYGPAQALDLVSVRDLAREVTQRDGSVFYYFIPDHIARVIGASSVAPVWGRRFSYYVLNEAGQPERRGDFMHGRPLITLAYALTRQSPLLRRLGTRLPIEYSDDDLRLVAALFVAIRARVAAQLHLERFLVVFPPVFDDEQARVCQQLIAALEAVNIDHLDLMSLYDANERRYRVADNNYHQSAQATPLMAAAMAAALEVTQ